ncbi:SRPBCC family protein [Nitrosomonas communis]|uniref:SRPBCC family protein n=1 Tax=Nitrosomonas communis TaxID=44574 RepID=UPI0026F33439|nr:SRPBCC family protein [Nitrosomonas communis]
MISKVSATEFKFTTEWRISAPLSEVYDTITQCHDWPIWWQSVEKVEKLVPGEASGVGSVHRFTWRGRIPYSLTFDMRVTRLVPLALIEGQASGEMVGAGRWCFFYGDGVTTVHYEWHVHTNRPWMNLIAPLARPLFSWNHHQVMRQGAMGLAHLLNASLESVHTERYCNRVR